MSVRCEAAAKKGHESMSLSKSTLNRFRSICPKHFQDHRQEKDFRPFIQNEAETMPIFTSPHTGSLF